MPDKNKEISKILLLTASVLLSGASVVFLLICLISDSEGPWVLPAALGCSVLSSLFSIVSSCNHAQLMSKRAYTSKHPGKARII